MKCLSQPSQTPTLGPQSQAVVRRSDYLAAHQLLQAARRACPLDRPGALAKIDRYLAATAARLGG